MTNQKIGYQRDGASENAWTARLFDGMDDASKLRHAMVRPGREQLSGDVEVDETVLGGLAPGDQGRREKNIVIIAPESRGQGIGRIRLAQLPDQAGSHIVNFVTANVAKGALIVSDGEWAYTWLKKEGYRHQRIPKAGSKELPRVHRIASLLKRWLLGTFQGHASDKHLQRYLDEFAFRFNRRNSALRGQLFYRLVQQCVGRSPTSYAAIIQAS